jgi:hypothetical protein
LSKTSKTQTTTTTTKTIIIRIMMKDMTVVVAAAAAAGILLSSAVVTTAFVLPKSNGRVVIPYTAGTEITRTSLIAATLDQPPTFNKNGTAPGLVVESHDAMGGSWECNDDATDCKQVPECDEQGLSCKTSLDVRIHGDWYDLTGT